jgi:hypothetical protein
MEAIVSELRQRPRASQRRHPVPPRCQLATHYELRGQGCQSVPIGARQVLELVQGMCTDLCNQTDRLQMPNSPGDSIGGWCTGRGDDGHSIARPKCERAGLRQTIATGHLTILGGGLISVRTVGPVCRRLAGQIILMSAEAHSSALK